MLVKEYEESQSYDKVMSDRNKIEWLKAIEEDEIIA